MQRGKGVLAVPGFIATYVRWVERLTRVIGRGAMYLIFVMAGVLLWSTLSKAFFQPAQWTLEMAQFTMAAYYLLGGGYSMQIDGHVRMDLLYGMWSPRRKALADCLTVSFLLFYLVMLLIGGISSTEYALQYGEESYSSWAPYMAPIKIIMCIGIVLMLLQVTASFLRDLAAARGRPMP